MYNPLDHRLRSRFQAIVGAVDHASTIGDKQEEGVFEELSPQTGRTFHLVVYKLGGNTGGIVLNVLVPQDVLGTFKVPQVGDVVWIEERRGDSTTPPVYIYSSYNGAEGENLLVRQEAVPQWGGFSGDYGHVRTYKDHNRQFLAVTKNTNFITKYVRSITGYRFRSFYRSNLEKGKYVLRGDPVFDIDGLVSEPYLVEDGAYIGYGGDLEEDQGKYPNPLNVPKEREEDEDYTYKVTHHRIFDYKILGGEDEDEDDAETWYPTIEEITLKNKNYISYQPIMDKEYLEEVQFEREIPAAEEYQLALRGNNKLLIQDQYGDGEQLLITLKNQYDAGITIVHNEEKGQVRIRDHLGQGVLMESNPDAPRVISWTSNRQVIEQGAVTGVGTFTYIRNGPVFGESQTNYGFDPDHVSKNDVPNQELLMVSNSDIVGELASRLSSGMNTWATGTGPGMFFRTSAEDTSADEQRFAIYDDEIGTLVTKYSTARENYTEHSWIAETAKDNIRVVENLSLFNGNTISRVYNATDSSTFSSEEHRTVAVGQGGAPLGYQLITRETAPDYSKETLVLENDSGDEFKSTYETGEGFKQEMTFEEEKFSEIEITDEFTKFVRFAPDDPESEIRLSEKSMDFIRHEGDVVINIGTGENGKITIGNSTADIDIKGKDVTIAGASIDLVQS